MKRIFFLLAVLSSTIQIKAQTTDVEESTEFKSVSTIKNNQNFETYLPINNEYSLYKQKSMSYDNIVGISDINGKVLLPHIFNYKSKKKGFVLLKLGTKYGMFNCNQQKWSIPLQYESLNILSDSLNSAKINDKIGIIDNYNNCIAPFEWTSIEEITDENQYFEVTIAEGDNQLQGVYGVAEKKIVIPCEYEILAYRNDLNAFLAKKDKYNIIDIKHKALFREWYNEIHCLGNNRFIVKHNNFYGIINELEETIIPIEYLEFSSYPLEDGSFLTKNKNNKYGLITADSQITLPFVYDKLITSSESNYLQAEQNSKFGLIQIIDNKPKEILHCIYDNIKENKFGYIIKQKESFGLLDMEGKMVLPIEFQSIEQLESGGYSSPNYKTKKNNRYKVHSSTGEELTTKSYTQIATIISTISSNSCFTYYKGQNDKGKMCIIDKMGKEITPFIFDDVYTENIGLVTCIINGKNALYSLVNQKTMIDNYDILLLEDDHYYGIMGNEIHIIKVNGSAVTITKTIPNR